MKPMATKVGEVWCSEGAHCCTCSSDCSNYILTSDGYGEIKPLEEVEE